MFPAPSVEVRGRRRADQAWINDTVESGVAACHWARPKARVIAKGKGKGKPKAKVARKPKLRGGIWLDAILPVPALPEPEPPAPARVDLKVNTPPPPPAPARHWPQTLFDRLDGRGP